MTDQFVVTLTTHTHGGEALGHLPDGRALFLPYALPGETVRVSLIEEKSNHARGELLEVLQASPQRVQPRCPHFTICGGCHYQHMSYPAQLEAKTTILRDQLERIGGMKDNKILPATASLKAWNYRNHIQFHLTPQGKLGFKGHHSEAVIPIQECHLPEDPLKMLWPQITLEPIPDLERVSLRLGVEEDVLLVLESSDPQAPEFSVDQPLSAVHLGPAGSILLCGSDYVVLAIPDRNRGRDRLFRVSAGSFFQVNTPMAAAMVEHLLENLPLKAGATVLDVYCGVGLFSAFLASQVERLVGIESSPAACYDFEVNLEEYDNVELYEAPAEIVLPNLNLKPDIIVVDPPRSGLERRTLDGILELSPNVLAYVSCDPATLGRDARRLHQGGYQLIQITPFDHFPQTYHIESISFWQRPD